MPTKADLILHPVRMRIIQALIGRQLTTAKIAEALPDVPPSSLYRHLTLLAESGIVSVVAEQRVRGALERTYAVSSQRAVITEADVRSLDRDDHKRMFMAFIASVIDGFERYLDQERIDFVADMVSYSQVTLHLDDDELRQYRADSAALVQRALSLPPRAGRRPRTISTTIVPEPVTGSASRPKPDKRGEQK